MSERSESNDPIDALIDHAARRLVAGQPSSSLRTSVRDRIGSPRPVWMLVPAWGVAIALVIAAMLVGRSFLSAPVERASVPAQERQEPVVPPDTGRSAAIQPEPIETRQFTRRPATASAPTPVEEESPIPPIAIEPLATAQIVVDDSSGVMPIEIAPLQIEPLIGQ